MIFRIFKSDFASEFYRNLAGCLPVDRPLISEAVDYYSSGVEKISKHHGTDQEY